MAGIEGVAAQLKAFSGPFSAPCPNVHRLYDADLLTKQLAGGTLLHHDGAPGRLALVQ